jgi:signal recognition particle subunit SRP54
MLPGVKPGALKDAQIDEKAMSHTEAIILSMTPYEREHPQVINAARKKRIALGSGTSVEEVNKLLRQHEQMSKIIKQFSGVMMGKGRKKGKMKMPFPM